MTDSDRQEEFLRLFLQHRVQVTAYIRSMVPNQADAEELFQDVAAVLWRKFDDFQLGTRFDHWACRVAHNHILTFFRRKRRDVLLFGEHVMGEIADELVRTNDVWTDRREALDACLKTLPPRSAELIQHRFQAASSNRSLAQQTGRSESAVSRALNRIYMILLECIRKRLELAAERTPQ